jgi:hypothetical protein
MAASPGARAFVEVKRASLVHHGRAHCIERILAALAPVRERCTLISFDADACRLARTSGGIEIGWVLDGDPVQLRSVLDVMRPEYVFCDHHRIPVGRSLPAGPWTWVVYEVTDAGQALDLARPRCGDGRDHGATPPRGRARLARGRERMTEPVFVAVDQGGHATRASAFTAGGELEGAALVTIATQRNALGHVEHDADEVVASARTALAELARLVPVERWAASGLAVQRSSIACWDAGSGRPLAPVISWQDTRGAAGFAGSAAARRMSSG